MACTIGERRNETKTRDMNILITGGTGLIGKRLTNILLENGHSVSILSRTKKQSGKVTYYTWDIENQEIESDAIAKAEVIVHLAGANVGEGKWTEKRKKEIIDSRVNSGNLLYQEVKKHNPTLKAFISSSAIGYYGMVTEETIFEETHPAGTDFLAEVCQKWEETANQFNQLNTRVALVRTGVVLDKKEGALAKLLTPIKLGIGSALGTGKQAMPWIHLEDICQIYRHLIENESLQGAFNGAAPQIVTNQEFSKTVATVLNKPFWFPKVPAFALKLLLGEQAVIALEGSPISSNKIEASGYKFRFTQLKPALKEILS